MSTLEWHKTWCMKKYLLDLLELRKRELTTKLNELENKYLGATASGLSGYGARVEEVRKEMEKIEACKQQLRSMREDQFSMDN